LLVNRMRSKHSFSCPTYGWTSTAPMQAHNFLWPAIERLLPGDAKKVLDIGCGNGFLASRLAQKGYAVTGIDVSPDGVVLAKKAYPDLVFEVASAYDNLTDRFGDDFDLVVSSEVIEHLYFPEILLRSAYSLLRVGGSLIVTTPYHGYLKNLALSLANKWDEHHNVQWEGGHIKFFSIDTLDSMLRSAGFRNVKFSNAGRVRWLWKSIVCRADKGFPSLEYV
jgi:SAM-dependent methyltransferase